MNCVAVFAVVPTWVANWLTPVWLLGVGALLGLILLLVGWGLLWALSWMPGMRAVQERPGLRWGVIAVASAACYAILLFLLVGSGEGGSSDGPGGLVGELLLLALAAAAVALTLVRLAAPKFVAEIPSAVREGVLWPVLILTVCLAVFGVTGFAVAHNPRGLLASLVRLPQVGRLTATYEFPAAPEDLRDSELAVPPPYPINVSFRRDELRELIFTSDQALTVTVGPSKADVFSSGAIEVPAGQRFTWRHGDLSESPFPHPEIMRLYVRNRGAAPARLELTAVTEPAYPETAVVGYLAALVVFVFAAYLLQRATMPKASAVALATLKSEIAQPLFMILLSMGAFMLILFIWIPYNTFGEDIKVLKDSGLTLIMVVGIIQAVWAASTSVAEEIEGKTALTVLSKPIRRRSFLLGKFLGIVWTVALMFLVLGVVFLVVISYKPIYDSREVAEVIPSWKLSYVEMVSVGPGLALAFMETVILAALSVAISTRLPLLPNFVICFAIYVLGHLTPPIVQSAMGRFEIVQFVGLFIATIFPNLELLDVQAAVASGHSVPFEYLGWSLVYCLIYTVIAMLLALVMFEDRDLA